MLKNHMVPIIFATLIIGIVCCLYFSFIHTDTELEQAKAETEKAKLALSMATAYSEQVKAELQETTLRADEAIEKSRAREAWLESSFAQAKRELQVVLADKNALQELIDNIPTSPPADIPTEKIMETAAQLYPDNDFSGIEVTANRDARDLFQMMIAEITERRKLSLINDKIIGDQQGQILRFGEINAELKMQLEAGEAIRNALENANEALTMENSQYAVVNLNLEKQVRVLEKKQRFQWLQKPAVAVALIGGFIIGGVVAK